MSGHWWRAYDEAIDDPKLCLLSDRAHRAWFNLMCLASSNGGVLPNVEILSVKLRMAPSKVAAVLDEIVGRGLLDNVDGSLQPHNWKGRQFKSDVTDVTAAERMRNYRNRRRNGYVTVTVPREQSTETDSETERKKEQQYQLGSRDSGPYAFEAGVIKLIQKHYDLWKKSFPNLSLDAELIGLAAWAAEQKNWFQAVSGALAKKQREAKERADRTAAEAAAKPDQAQRDRDRYDPRL